METEELAKNLDDSTDAVEPQLQEISVDEIMEPSGQKNYLYASDFSRG